MTSAPSTLREEPLQKLQALCQALAEALGRAGFEPAKVLEAFQNGVTAECIRCNIHISGEELFALSQPPSDQMSNVKIGRLRLGDCARQGCQSYTYRLTFRNSPTLDWPKVISQAEAIQRGDDQPASPLINPRETLHRVAHSGLAHRLALALLLGGALLLVRQWYYGGRIPFLREPEHFHVATVSSAEAQHTGEARVEEADAP